MVGGNDDVYEMDVEEKDDDGEEDKVFKTPKGKGRVNQRRNVPERIGSEDDDSENDGSESNDTERNDSESIGSESIGSESTVQKSGDHI